ncbi:glycerate kinase, partial [Pseudomonas putida S11]
MAKAPMDAILAASHGELRRQTVRGPLGQSVEAGWGWLPQSRTAIIEMAQASGLQLVPTGQRDACRSSTWGTGELIAAALAAGAQRVVLAIGGSATNDAGSGMLRALGLRLLDAHGQALEQGGLALAKLARIDASDLDPRLAEVQFEVAADVDNPLCGANGASAIFGPQKGANPTAGAGAGPGPGAFCRPLCATAWVRMCGTTQAVALLAAVGFARPGPSVGALIPPWGGSGGRTGRPGCLGARCRPGSDRRRALRRPDLAWQDA